MLISNAKKHVHVLLFSFGCCK